MFDLQIIYTFGPCLLDLFVLSFQIHYLLFDLRDHFDCHDVLGTFFYFLFVLADLLLNIFNSFALFHCLLVGF